MKTINTVSFISAFGSLLVGGVFYGFSTFVMGALAAITPSAGIAAMQSINIVVKNFWFLLFLFGLIVPCLWLGYESFMHRTDPAARLRLYGSLLYVLGTLGVTFLFNVPRNDALAVLDPGSPEAAIMWASFVPSWTFWNHVRCATSCAASVLFTLSLRTGA